VGTLAATDSAVLADLLREVSSADAAVQALLAQVAEDAGAIPPDVTFKEFDETAADDVKYCTCPECGHRFPV
jgi:hypothetical protein